MKLALCFSRSQQKACSSNAKQSRQSKKEQNFYTESCTADPELAKMPEARPDALKAMLVISYNFFYNEWIELAFALKLARAALIESETRALS